MAMPDPINIPKNPFNNKDLTSKQIYELLFPSSAKGSSGSKKSNSDKKKKEDQEEYWEEAGSGNKPSATDLLGTGASAADQINLYKNLLASYGQLEGYTPAEYTDVVNPEVMSLQMLQQVLGSNINYDFNSIKNIYDQATKTGYEIEQQSGAEKSYYKHLADAQNTALDTIRNQYSGAVATGASKGMQAANRLSTILGIGNTANEEATQIAIDKQTRANQYAAEMAKNAKDALSYSNDQQSNLASLSRQLFNDQIQQQTAQLAYNQGINTDTANAYAARTQAQGNLNGSLANTVAGIYNNNQSATASLQAAIEQAQATKYAAEQQRSKYAKKTKDG